MNLIKLIFDGDLYKFSTGTENTDKINFIEHLVRHQALDTGQGADMLIHFTNDMQDIVTAGGQAQDQYNNLNKALIAFGLQAYYQQTPGFTQEVFDNFAGGLRFDRGMIPGSLSDLKGYGLYFHAYLQNRLPDLLGDIESKLPTLPDWFIATGAHAASATAGPRAAFMLGSEQADHFTGSPQSDMLVGGAGNDILEGNQGTHTPRPRHHRHLSQPRRPHYLHLERPRHSPHHLRFRQHPRPE